MTEPTIDHVIETYTPRNLDFYQWQKVRPFVQRAVRSSTPNGGDDARRRMGEVGGLVCWAHFIAGRALDPVVIFDPSVIGEYANEADGLSLKVRKNMRARLKLVGKAINPAWPLEFPEETAYTSGWRPNPYSPDEVLQIEGWVVGQRTARRRVFAGVLTALALGGGLYSHEIALARVRDIAVDDEGVLVQVHGEHPRTVPIRARWEQPLIDLAANIDRDDYAFMPGRTNRQTSVINTFVQSTNRTPGVEPSAQRMRATWIVELIRAQVPAPALLKAAGLVSLRGFERWLYAVPEFTTQEFRAWLRGGQ